jgi:hypothetical protein
VHTNMSIDILIDNLYRLSIFISVTPYMNMPLQYALMLNSCFAISKKKKRQKRAQRPTPPPLSGMSALLTIATNEKEAQMAAVRLTKGFLKLQSINSTKNCTGFPLVL